MQIGTGSGSFSQSITGLPSNTTLYARAYAINSVGIAYGSQVSFATNSLLPVSLLQLSAHQKPEGVHLQWSTVSEEAAKDFEIQYSTDGRQWSYIGTVAATGNTTSIRHYQFTHRHATNGTNYYRLLQRDLDGKSTFSKVVQVTISTGSVFAIHNNPVSDRIIKISMQVSETVQLYNGAGALVLHQKLQPGIHTINVQRLPGGMYQIKAGRETRTLILK